VAGLQCDSCVPGFPNPIEPPNLIPGEDCDAFLEFYEEKVGCCDLDACRARLDEVRTDE